MPLTPAERLDDEKIRDQALHTRPDRVLTAMRASHQAKVERTQADYDDWHSPDFIAGERHRLMRDAGMSRGEANAEIAERVAYWDWKHPKLIEVVRLCDVETGFRRDGKVTR